MKKIIVLAVALVAAVMSQAACVAWQYGATKEDAGSTVYVLIGATAQTTWENVGALQEKAVSHGEVGLVGRAYAASGTATSADITKTSANLYYVVVAEDGKSFSVTSVADMTASVYDPAAQEGQSAVDKSLSSKNLTQKGLAWGSGSDPVVPTPTPIDPSGVPEPTSGLLLLVGGAALALRRKQK